jgi:hypothetical protein
LRCIYFEEPVVDPICPDCRQPIKMEFAVTVYPVFWTHYRGDRKACRLCLYRHPVSLEVTVRVVPDYMTFGDYLPVIVSELKAIAGKAGML